MLGHKFAQELFSLLDLDLDDPLMVVDLAKLHLSIITRYDEEDGEYDIEKAVNDEGLEADRAVGDVEVVLDNQSKEHD